MDRKAINDARIKARDECLATAARLTQATAHEAQGWRSKSLSAAMVRLHEAASLLVPPHGLNDPE